MENKTLSIRIRSLVSWFNAALQSDKRLFTNFLSLGLVQFTNFALPLLTYPYLFQTVGVSYFGAITYGLNLMLYLSTLTDYGFNLSAPKSVALAHNNKALLETIISTVLQTKLYFFLTCGLVVLTGIMFIDNLQQYSLLYTFGLLYVAGSCALPTWLFQGLEDMRHITWINLIAKAGATLLIFAIVRQPEDYWYTIGLFGIANVVSGVLGILYACRKYKLILHWQPFLLLVNEIRTGFYFFLSSFSTVAYNNSTVFILGIFVTNDIIGVYGFAEKIVSAIWQLLNIFSQATYPVLCRLAANSHYVILKFIRTYYIPFIGLIALLCILMAVTAESIARFMTGNNQPDIVVLLRVLSLVPFIVCLNIPAYQLLLVYEKQKVSALVFNLSIVSNAVVCTVLSALYGAIGAAWSAVFTQITVTLALHWVLAKRFPAYTLWTSK